MAGISINKWNALNQLKVFYWKPSFFKLHFFIKQLRTKTDYTYINGLYSPWFNMLPLLISPGKKIVSVRGMLHPGALSQKKIKKRVYLSFFKLFRWHKKNIFHATDEQEAGFIRKVFGNYVKIKVAPNIPHFIGNSDLISKQTGSVNLITVALISPMKNVLLVLQALKDVKATVNYTIYGPLKDEQYWQQCLQEIKNMPPNICVEYRGPIEPSLVPDHIQQNHVFILPSKSENFGHAIFESLSSSRPVITSEFTPWNKLEQLKAGWNVDISSVQSLSAIIEKIAAMNQQQYDEYCRGAMQMATQYMNNGNFKQAYHELFS